MILDVKKRKHLNSDEFEFVMDHLNIDIMKIKVFSENIQDENITFENKKDKESFKDFLDLVSLDYELKDDLITITLIDNLL